MGVYSLRDKAWKFYGFSALSAQQHFRRTEKGLHLRQKPQPATRVVSLAIVRMSLSTL
jgi:hypothetical protein